MSYKHINVRKLIECVKEHSALYDSSNDRYMDSEFKNAIWDDIGKQLQAAGAICKLRWYSIRDTYRKSLTRSKTTKKNIMQYKYGDELSFLRSYIKDIPSKRILTENRSTKTTTSNSNYNENENKIKNVQMYDSELKIKCEVNEENEELNNEMDHVINSESDSQKIDRKHIINDVTANCATQHPVDTFLNGIKPTLKTLSPYHLNLAKSEIFAIVQKYELKMITGEK